jgi:hypothetical protein
VALQQWLSPKDPSWRNGQQIWTAACGIWEQAEFGRWSPVIRRALEGAAKGFAAHSWIGNVAAIFQDFHAKITCFDRNVSSNV